MILRPGKYLVTTNQWFYGPDGEQYKAVYGRATVASIEDTLGFIPSRPSTNWYLRIGGRRIFIVVAGCQIHYLIRTDDRPLQMMGTTQSKDDDTSHPRNQILFLD